MNNENNYKGDISFWGLLQVVFITLKILNLIDWSWIKVLIPTFIYVGLILFIVFLSFLIDYLEENKNE